MRPARHRTAPFPFFLLGTAVCAALAVLVGLSGCGLQLGLPTPVPSSSSNGGVPGASLVAQAALGAESGASVSGSAAVYSQGNGNYVVQLQNLSAFFPTTPETVDAEIGGLRVTGSALLSATGTTSYSFSTLAGAGAQFEAIYIHCTMCSLQTDYAVATF